jgi:flagellar protein FlaJ
MKKIFTKSNLICISTICLGIVLLLASFFYVSGSFAVVLNVTAFILIFGVPIGYNYYESERIKDIEKNFPSWLSDVARNIRSGMTLSEAIVKTKENRYGAFSKILERAIMKLAWNASLEDILSDMRKHCKSKLVSEAITSIIEANRSGGRIAEMLEGVSKSTSEINKLNEERRSLIQSSVMNGYIIFIVFLVVIVILKTYLVPMLSTTEGGAAIRYETIFHLVIIQSIFSGLIIGKMSEGKVTSGLKHSLALFLMSYIVFQIF